MKRFAKCGMRSALLLSVNTREEKPKPKISIDNTAIPIPPVRTGPKSGTRFKYPFNNLEVGQSFFVEGIEARNLGGSVTHAEKVLGFKFTTRTMDGGARVWRVK